MHKCWVWVTGHRGRLSVLLLYWLSWHTADLLVFCRPLLLAPQQAAAPDSGPCSGAEPCPSPASPRQCATSLPQHAPHAAGQSDAGHKGQSETFRSGHRKLHSIMASKRLSAIDSKVNRHLHTFDSHHTCINKTTHSQCASSLYIHCLGDQKMTFLSTEWDFLLALPFQWTRNISSMITSFLSDSNSLSLSVIKALELSLQKEETSFEGDVYLPDQTFHYSAKADDHDIIIYTPYQNGYSLSLMKQKIDKYRSGWL